MAKERNYTIFAVQNDGHCQGSADPNVTYDKYGPATNCQHGRGGGWANDVYRINPDGVDRGGELEQNIYILKLF